VGARAGSRPDFLYGTAWKEERTAGLVRQALEAGFRGIDTANQRKHYHEAGVGEALKIAFSDGLVTREELFLQTKFTFQTGQDHRLPYDPEADLTTQVRQSLESSLEHLKVDYLDSYVLHGPSQRGELGDADLEVWAAMEGLLAEGTTRALGVSNVCLNQLEALCHLAAEPPAFVQNRCYARSGWDREVRAFCREQDIVYQGFSLLTANRSELAQASFLDLVEARQVPASQVVFRFAQQVGMLPLTGTCDPKHMEIDLACGRFELTPEELSLVEEIGSVS
jgi:diketogulonate reductase-like aldo/keto reductase